ncbi:MAG TPA: SUMF1/EgtB/PvdO family nonheme iron enzyme [Sedimentisphaerales bacterium]|nr:SUMF1/EgtB/PvdO family nonheme iron enzyme [Sedimentisphaerales bacterium]
MATKTSLKLALILSLLAYNQCIGDSNPADIYADCRVDWLDLKILAADWLSAGPTAADIDNSGDVNFPDYAILANNWGWTCPPPPNDMLLIPAGSFQMGDAFSEGGLGELPVHPVTLDSFYIGKYELTNAQYCAYLNSSLGSSIYVSAGVVYGSGNNQPYCDTSGSRSFSQIDYNDGAFTVRTKGGRDMSNDPMLVVSWYGAVAYCNWRSQQEEKELCYNLSTWECDFTKNGYRLPTEAEWEYAARGGLHDPYCRYPWGDTIDGSKANYWSSGDPYEIAAYPWTTPVGFYDGSQTPPGTDMANGYGLYDMAGNLWEWCNDWYSSTYYSTTPYPHVNPTGPTSGSYRVLRGGSWFNLSFNCRLAYRSYNGPVARDLHYGFRLSLDSE